MGKTGIRKSVKWLSWFGSFQILLGTAVGDSSFENREVLPQEEGDIEVIRPLVETPVDSLGWKAWWEWTASKRATVTIKTWGRMAVYRGSDIEKLALLNESNEYVTFEALEGETYQFATNTDRLSIVIAEGFNDQFADRFLLEGKVTKVLGHNFQATREENEPSTLESTVWWEWKSTVYDPVSIEVNGRYGADFGFRVFRQGEEQGNQLIEVHRGMERKYFPIPGETWYISVGGRESGVFELSLEQPIARSFQQPNDFFADRIELASVAPIAFSGELWGSRLERGEPDQPGSSTHSIWWEWKAPETGVFKISHHVPENIRNPRIRWPYVDISVYRGKDLESLNLMSDSDGYFYVEEESSVMIRMSGRRSDSIHGMPRIPIGVRIQRTIPVSDNDAFQNRISLPSEVPFEIAANDYQATIEPGEPAIHEDLVNGTLWWDWTCSVSDVYILSSSASVGVYQGEALGELSHLFSMQGGYSERTSRFSAEKGKNYSFASSSLTFPEYWIGLHRAADNDLIEFAKRVSGERFLLEGDLAGAASDPSELWLSGPRNLWWEWQAPSAGRLELDASMEREGHLNVFLKEDNSELRRLHSVYLSGGIHEIGVESGGNYVFEIADDRPVKVQIDGKFSDSRPSNDDFSDAVDLGVIDTVSVLADIDRANSEAWELERNPGNSLRTLWYTLEPRVSGKYIATVENTDVSRYSSTSIAFFEGENHNDLEPVKNVTIGQNSRLLLVELLEGRSYKVRLSADRSSEGMRRFLLLQSVGQQAPEQAVEMVGLPSENYYASVSRSGDETHWWKWKSPGAGLVRFSFLNSSGSTNMYRILGDGEQVLEASGTWGVDFFAVKGEEYLFSTRRAGVYGVKIERLEEGLAKPRNDDFDNRTVLGDEVFDGVEANLFCSTYEPGEPVQDSVQVVEMDGI